LSSAGVELGLSCGGMTHWVHKVDWTTGYPVWSGQYGGDLNAPSNKLIMHPNKELFCGFLAGSSINIPTTCDLDFTGTFNIGDADPSPGDPSAYWSLFAFCQNISSSSVLPPFWTHVISAALNSPGFTYITYFRNSWAGNDMLIQGASRSRQSQSQALIWPATGEMN